MSKGARKTSKHQSVLMKEWLEETPHHDGGVAEDLTEVGGIARRPLHPKFPSLRPTEASRCCKNRTHKREIHRVPRKWSTNRRNGRSYKLDSFYG